MALNYTLSQGRTKTLKSGRGRNVGVVGDVVEGRYAPRDPPFVRL